MLARQTPGCVCGLSGLACFGVGLRCVQRRFLVGCDSKPGVRAAKERVRSATCAVRDEYCLHSLGRRWMVLPWCGFAVGCVVSLGRRLASGASEMRQPFGLCVCGRAFGEVRCLWGRHVVAAFGGVVWSSGVRPFDGGDRVANDPEGRAKLGPCRRSRRKFFLVLGRRKAP